jgi:hypothetical protein
MTSSIFALIAASGHVVPTPLGAMREHGRASRFGERTVFSGVCAYKSYWQPVHRAHWGVRSGIVRSPFGARSGVANSLDYFVGAASAALSGKFTPLQWASSHFQRCARCAEAKPE